MPLLGWGMLSAAAYPVVLFGGWHLPAILPQSDSVHTLLWDAHFYLAFAFFALILLHVAAALFHALVRRDGVCADQRDEIAAVRPRAHSITSSARASRAGGTSRPSALAVLRLMTSSNFVGCSTGMSAGFAPRRILST
jgi:hypothetical protein